MFFNNITSYSSVMLVLVYFIKGIFKYSNIFLYKSNDVLLSKRIAKSPYVISLIKLFLTSNT